MEPPDELIRACLEGDVTPRQLELVEQLLRTDSDFRQTYLRYFNLDEGLESAIQVPANGEGPMFPDSARRPFAFWLSIAAGFLLCLFGGFLWFHSFMESHREPAPNACATLLFTDECTWGQGISRSEGQRLTPDLLQLVRGMAVIRFDGGAEMVLRGETQLQLSAAAEATLLQGEVVVRATEGAEGFRLRTPASEVVDLGTEFQVRVEAGGATEVHVLEGEVAWCKEDQSWDNQAILPAGHAVRFDRPGLSQPRTVEFKASSFQQRIQEIQPRERPDLMTVYEGFHYDEGTYQPSDILKGLGWAGPWRLRQGIELRNPNETDSTTDMRIVHGGLSVPWPIPGGRLGGLEMPAGRSFRIRPMQHGIKMASDGITYFSLMTLEPQHSPRKRPGRPQEGVRLTFRSSEDYWGPLLSFGWDKKLQPHIQAGALGSFVSPARVPDEQSLLWVGKIIHRSHGEDEVVLRIYGQQEPLDYVEPPTWHVASRGLNLDAVFDLVIISSTGSSPRIVDELRIGPTWRSVVPISHQTASAQ